MKLSREISLEHFEFWGGAKVFASHLSTDELQKVEGILEENYPDGMTDAELNDLFWFDNDTVAEWLGYENAELIEGRDDFYFMLNAASEVIDEIKDEMVPEFELNDLHEYFAQTGTDLHMFLYENGYKDYIAEISDCTVEEAEAEDYFSDYEDTLNYIELEKLQMDIEQAKELSHDELETLRTAVVDAIDAHKDDLSFDRSEAAEKISDLLDKTEIPEGREQEEVDR